MLSISEINDKVNVSLKFKNVEMANEFCDLIDTQKARNNIIKFLDFLYPKDI